MMDDKSLRKNFGFGYASRCHQQIYAINNGAMETNRLYFGLNFLETIFPHLKEAALFGFIQAFLLPKSMVCVKSSFEPSLAHSSNLMFNFKKMEIQVTTITNKRSHLG